MLPNVVKMTMMMSILTGEGYAAFWAFNIMIRYHKISQPWTAFKPFFNLHAKPNDKTLPKALRTQA